jgi:hypothetical protein
MNSSLNSVSTCLKVVDTRRTRDEGPTPYFAVDFDPSFGIGATFTCLRVEIVEALPCNAEGSPTS